MLKVKGCDGDVYEALLAFGAAAGLTFERSAAVLQTAVRCGLLGPPLFHRG